tara:strand:- start:6916 stop:7032 length:117 start_codon:yes stop_codon:yes gene_type:complete
MLFTILVSTLIVIATVVFTSKNKKKVRTIKVPVDKRKF